MSFSPRISRIPPIFFSLESTSVHYQRGEPALSEKQLLHSQLSYKIIGCAQKVHRVLGPGFPESVYHNSLCYELLDERIPFESEKTAEVYYGKRKCGEFRMDLVVDSRIILELKALERLNDNHMAQAMSYLKATGLRLALLINFGNRSLETKRVVL